MSDLHKLTITADRFARHNEALIETLSSLAGRTLSPFERAVVLTLFAHGAIVTDAAPLVRRDVVPADELALLRPNLRDRSVAVTREQVRALLAATRYVAAESASAPTPLPDSQEERQHAERLFLALRAAVSLPAWQLPAVYEWTNRLTLSAGARVRRAA
ncbi:MAG: hypothetical protein NW201_12615 [Gemmatimonadales bacterium]|nr:hypothetical protein [Gemmatimonadales bacterium]